MLSAKLDVYNGGARLPMDTLATGMYLVTVTTSTQTVNTKIFKNEKTNIYTIYTINFNFLWRREVKIQYHQNQN